MSNRDHIADLERERGIVQPAENFPDDELQAVVGTLVGENDEWYHHLFGGIHTAGKLIASIFPGGAALSSAAESLESPILPDWAKSGPKVPAGAAMQAGVQDAMAAAQASKKPAVLVKKPETVAVVKKGSDKPEAVLDVVEAAVVGGKRFEAGRAVGFQDPDRVAFKLKGGKVASFEGLGQILFMGGSESQTRVAGEVLDMDFELLGKQLLGQAGWTEINGGCRVLGATGEYEIHEPADPVEVTESDYIYGTCVLGAFADLAQRIQRTRATQPRAGFVLRATPTGRVFTSLATTSASPKSARTSIANARDVGRRAQQLGNRILKAVKRGGATHVVGALRPKRSAGELASAAQALIAAGKDLEKRASTFQSFVDAKAARDAKAKAQAQKFVSKTKSAVSPRAGAAAFTRASATAARAPQRVIGDTDEYDIIEGDLPEVTIMDVLGDDEHWTEILGALHAQLTQDLVGAPTDPDPLNPGFLIDGSPDPNYTGEGGDAGTAATDTGQPGYQPPGPPNYGLEAQPTEVPPYEGFVPDPFPNQAVDDPNEYDSTKRSLPAGFVYYDGQKGFSDRMMGSVTYYTGGAKEKSVSTGASTSGFVWWGNHFGFVDQSQMGDRVRYAPTVELRDSIPAISANSMARGWGPIVGNPADPDWKHARMDAGTGRLFWYRDTAPKWATLPDDLERLNKAILDWKTEWTKRKTDYDAWVAYDALQREEAEKMRRDQAKADEETARRQTREQAELEHQQAVEEQRYATEEAAQEQEASRLDLDAQRAWLEYVKTHPEAMVPEGAPDFDMEEGVDWETGRAAEEAAMLAQSNAPPIDEEFLEEAGE